MQEKRKRKSKGTKPEASDSQILNASRSAILEAF